MPDDLMLPIQAIRKDVLKQIPQQPFKATVRAINLVRGAVQLQIGGSSAWQWYRCLIDSGLDYVSVGQEAVVVIFDGEPVVIGFLWTGGKQDTFQPVTRHMDIGAASWRGGVTAPGETFAGITPVLDFDNGKDDAAHYVTWVPYRWDNTTDMTVSVHWMHDTGADTGKARWKLVYLAPSCGDDPTGAGTTISQDSAGTHPADTVICTEFTTKMLHTNMTRMDDLSLRLWRDSLSDPPAGDLAEPARFISLHIHYTQNRHGEPA